MNILVTGANGQLGNEMRRASQKSCHQYIFTDIAELDITDASATRRKMEECHVDVVVNCAAYTNVDKAEDDAAKAALINDTAVGVLAKAAKEVDATIIHVSTDYVFDGKACTPYVESDSTFPTGVYGQTKLAGEKSVIASGCHSIIIRTAWLYSQWGNNFVKTMRRLTAERDNLSVVFDQVGTPTFAGDLADAICHIIETGQIDKTGLYHFSNEGVCSWYDFAIAIRNLSGNKCDIRPIRSEEYSSKVARPHYSVLDKTKFRTTFGFKIPHWHESLIECINQLSNQQ